MSPPPPLCSLSLLLFLLPYPVFPSSSGLHPSSLLGPRLTLAASELTSSSALFPSVLQDGRLFLQGEEGDSIALNCSVMAGEDLPGVGLLGNSRAYDLNW